MSGWRSVTKSAFARLPWSAELYQRRWADGSAPTGGYAIDRLASHLPAWVEAVGRARRSRASMERADIALPRRLLVFGYLQWWLEYSVALALLLRAEGYEVKLCYLPYRRWHADPHPFDLRRQWAYLHSALAPLATELGMVPLLSRAERISEPLVEAMEAQSRLDVQYTLQREEIDWEADAEAGRLLALRQARNLAAARAAYRLLRQTPYEAVVIPNGSILEFGAIYRTARFLGTRAVTYEFGEQRQRLWLAQDDEVMRLSTAGLWESRGERPLSDDQVARLQELYNARRGGRSWSHFARHWQRSESEGAQAVRRRLGLSIDKPVVLLCTNVVGDSLALNRQVFTHGMAEWLAETVRALAGRPDVVLVVRAHPGEMLGAGHPSTEIVRQVLPELPPQVVLVPPESPVNTYDLIELAHLGLVYTSTVGLEMAMYGVPVVVAGDTHYRGKGFTHDPASMAQYLAQVDSLLRDEPGRALPQEQVELAWRYAYLFFFQYPFPFPWHLLSFWEDLEERPLEQVVAEGGLQPYRRTVRSLAGEPVEWAAAASGLGHELEPAFRAPLVTP